MTPEGATAPQAPTDGGTAQIVHTYDVYKTHGNVAKAFEREAAALARVGWRVQSQSAGGMITANFKRQPATLTVVYTRG